MIEGNSRCERGFLIHAEGNLKLIFQRIKSGLYQYDGHNIRDSLNQWKLTKNQIRSRANSRLTCRWCGEPLKKYGYPMDIGSMHGECEQWYLAYRGKTKDWSSGRYAREPRNCEFIDGSGWPCGGLGQELDHIIAWGVALEQEWDEDFLFAHTPGNLQWLCHKHHSDKTARDIDKIRMLRLAKQDE